MDSIGQLSWDGILSTLIAVAVLWVGRQQKKRAELDSLHKAYGVIYAAWFELDRMLGVLDRGENKFDPSALDGLREYYAVLGDRALIERIEKAYSEYRGLERKFLEKTGVPGSALYDRLATEAANVSKVQDYVGIAFEDLQLHLSRIETRLEIEKRTWYNTGFKYLQHIGCPRKVVTHGNRFLRRIKK